MVHAAFNAEQRRRRNRLDRRPDARLVHQLRRRRRLRIPQSCHLDYLDKQLHARLACTEADAWRHKLRDEPFPDDGVCAHAAAYARREQPVQRLLGHLGDEGRRLDLLNLRVDSLDLHELLHRRRVARRKPACPIGALHFEQIRSNIQVLERIKLSSIRATKSIILAAPPESHC